MVCFLYSGGKQCLITSNKESRACSVKSCINVEFIKGAPGEGSYASKHCNVQANPIFFPEGCHKDPVATSKNRISVDHLLVFKKKNLLSIGHASFFPSSFIDFVARKYTYIHLLIY